MNKEIKINDSTLNKFVGLLIEAIDATSERMVDDLIDDGATVTELALYKDFLDRFMIVYSDMIFDLIEIANQDKEGASTIKFGA